MGDILIVPVVFSGVWHTSIARRLRLRAVTNSLLGGLSGLRIGVLLTSLKGQNKNTMGNLQ